MLVEHRIQEQNSATPGAHRLQRAEIGIRVHCKQRHSLRWTRLMKLQVRLCSNALEHSRQSGGCFGVIRTGIVSKTTRMGKDGDRHLRNVLTSTGKLLDLACLLTQGPTSIVNLLHSPAIPAPIQENETGGEEEDDTYQGQHGLATPPAHQRQSRAIEGEHRSRHDRQHT